MESLTDLVRRSQAGDLHAYGEVVKETQGTVYAVACRVLRDPALAQDAMQDTYVRAYRLLPNLQEHTVCVKPMRRIWRRFIRPSCCGWMSGSGLIPGRWRGRSSSP